MSFKKIEDPREFAKLFNIRSFKQDYSNFINDLMRKLYQIEGKWGKLLSDGNYGVINTNYDLTKAPMSKDIREFYIDIYDNVDPKWSLLNYVNTNWSSFMHIVNTLNYWISTGQIKNEEQLLFKNDYFDDLTRMKFLLVKMGKYIFFPNDNLTCFYKIMGAIATTTYLGNLGENLTLESLTNLGEISDVVKSNPGQRLDTHGGVDISFKLDGVKKTIQCKTFNNWKLEYGEYVFTGIAGHSWYDVDYFSFVNKFQKLLFVFNVKKNGVVYKQKGGVYTFDNSLLKFKKNI